jgi:hypothetical protein
MSRNTITVLTYHCHKLSDLIYRTVQTMPVICTATGYFENPYRAVCVREGKNGHHCGEAPSRDATYTPVLYDLNRNK